MKVQGLRFILIFVFSLLTIHFSHFTVSYAAHPLITDDAGTQGKGKIQIEINSEFSRDKEKEGGVAIKERGGELATIISYGITDNADIVLGIPYQWFRIKEDGDTVEKEDGISDISLELKWRFFEKDGLSLALKPGITLPTGDEDRGLGTGRVTYRLFFITTKEIKPWAFHLNLGYIRNENKVDERKDLWHLSLASEVEVTKDLKAVANIGIERNPDKSSNTHPAFILGGLIYSINENIDIDFGIKGGLNKPETDLTFLAGMALRF
jgi:hypothetical protein